MNKESLIANLERAINRIESERAQRGLQPMGIKCAKVLSAELEEADGHLRFALRQVHALKITEYPKPKLSAQSHWLLHYLAENETFSAYASAPCHYSQQPDMTNVRGLIRRGWATEEMNGGYIKITPEGRRVALIVGAPPAVKNNP